MTPAEKSYDTDVRKPRDLRYREQFFPNADRLVFDVGDKGFVPVPIILRKLFRILSSPEIRILLYLYLRASRYGICYPSHEEIVHDLGLAGKKNLLPHIASLEEKRFLSVCANGSRTFYLIHDPRIAILHRIEQGLLKNEDLFEINDLYADLNQSQVIRPRQAAK